MAEEVRTRQREQETRPGGDYELLVKEAAQFLALGMNGGIVVKESEREWEQCPQGRLKFHLAKSEFPDTVLQDWYVYTQDVQQRSGRQRQQGGVVLFAIEDEGSTEVNGERIDWEAGDCLLLPLQRDGVEHVHFSRGGSTARWIAFVYEPGFNQVAGELSQLEVCTGFPALPEKPAPRTPERESVPPSGSRAILSQRAQFVERQNKGAIVVRDSDREWEISRQGHLKYFLLPAWPNSPVSTVLDEWAVFIHDVKKQSGKHRHQGGLVLYVTEGEGATEVNGERIEWEAGDLILLPVHPDGIEHVHFNRGTGAAKWLAFVFWPIFSHVASELTQTAVLPELQQTPGGG